VGSDVNKVTVPVNTMLFRAEGPRLAVIGSDEKVQLRPINIGRDYGATLEILGGVSPGDQVVVNPADSLEDGQQVNVAQPAPDQPQQGQPSPGQKQEGGAK
jgi:multidrug efflux pump subunit AcrA (membrane-fusion protein)